MKKVLSLLLVLTLCVVLCVPAFAEDKTIISSFTSETQGDYYQESYNFTDSVGETYKIVFEKTPDKTTTIAYGEQDSFISKSEWITGSDYITNTFTTPATMQSVANTAVDTVQISSLVADDSLYNTVTISEEVQTRGGDSIPGSTSYAFYKTFNTDFIYQGNILKGDSYYKKVGTFTVSNRMSYTFARNTTITLIATLLGGAYSWITGTTKVLLLLGGMGISVAGSAITTSWDINCAVHSYPFDFQSRMTYNGRSVTTSQIRRNLEYLYAQDKYTGNSSYVFDDFSYNNPDEAVGGFCSEAVGYGAKAFDIKYITGNNPNLSLPVTGPIW